MEAAIQTIIAWLVEKHDREQRKREYLQRQYPNWASTPLDAYDMGEARGRIDGFGEALDFIRIFTGKDDPSSHTISG